ncbi:hypothetical protein [Erythrobacter sp. WG]|uniref:hypothetical protein n=1 Tax=Erythrobacter sp. WG TaxID=2985510 RepID=UPI002270279D|nr:hypothetical protein [Erythrobacter sp. WG]MCX9146918.1 hypothetical protein [Erythrobacter sp. WG]
MDIIQLDTVVESELAQLAPCVGADLPGYRNHIYRVLTYAMHFMGGEARWRRPFAFALAYHDVGMWTDRTLAYLDPSAAQAEAARRDHAPDLDAALIHDLIVWHHKLTPFRGANAAAVNALRKADWVDASQGMIRKGLTRAQIAAVNAALPVHGFPDTLMRLAGELNHGHRTGGLLRVLHKVYRL